MKAQSMAAILIAAFMLATGCEPDAGSGGSPASSSPPAATGPHWQALAALEAPPQAFAVTADMRGSYRIGEELRFTVQSAVSGELHVLQVDGSDAVTVLLPNAALPDNRIEAGKPFAFPPPGGVVRILAEGPPGASLLAFVVTREGQRIEALLPVLFPAAAPVRGLALNDAPSPSAPPATTPAWSFARYTIRVEDALP
jgi:hypothetical protein